MVQWVRRAGMLLVTAIALAVVLLVVAWLLRPDVSDTPFPYTPEQIAEAESLRDVSFDPNNTPTLHVHTTVKPQGESPLLEALVREGKLPPLAERLPEKPVVMRGVDGIGKYGGTWLRIANAEEDVSIITYRLSGATLVRWSPLGYPIEPHVAESVEPNADKTVWTVKLRKGIRWSDGVPYTADDIMYWWEAEGNNKAYSSLVPAWMVIDGKPGRIVKVDDFTVRFEFDVPYVFFLEQLVPRTELCNTPKHYLKKFHPDPAIGDAEVIEATRKRYALPSATAVYSHMKAWNDPEHPRLWPWIYRTFRSNAPHVFVRNPYYFVVDEAGNQLPYIDRLQFDVQDGRLLAMSAANGAVSMQGRHVRFNDYTELMSRREQAGTQIYHWFPAVRSLFVINPNLNRRIDPNDPSTRKKAELLSNKQFRQALSLAINRWQIIRADYLGIGEPSQVAPGVESPFHSEKLARAFIDYDPQRANEMLDALGLTKRDSEGMRTFPDGSRMTFYLNFTAFTGVGPAQFVVDDWANVGIRCIIRERTRPLFYVEKDAMNFDFAVWSGESDFMPVLKPRYFIAADGESFYAVGWGRWWERGGFYGNPAGNRPGAIPVPRDHPMYAAMAAYAQVLKTPDPVEQKKHVEELMSIVADNLWTINIATAPPFPIVVNKDLRNVPRNALWGVIFCTPANAGIETYYFDHPFTSEGAAAALTDSLFNPTLRPSPRNSDSGLIGRVVRTLFITVGLLLVLMLAVRHPFIGKRLLIMIPTLAVISVIVFTVIQLPPGDYLTSRIILLQENGDEAAMRTVEDLRKMFRYEDPAWQRYCRWVGLTWFTTFDAADAGLLQGSLGRSMETGNLINNMVGDRLLLTIAISVGTILMTWAIAIPIGIYSAVRQYSIGDYILTVIGFVGMCVPAFLLALVLMAVSGVSGLFSPFYAAQPDWSWGKFVDLLKHIWIPIVVLGVGGTAGMIRVMRANLLDELRKPYVTTATAKGVRPLKLLIKYPVRLALNPFVSGIGHLFPQIVSGGAIVAMVLALPTIGPMLLSALFTEDMYLAGSMLMLLSLLGIIGTLVSDLLLLALDPRIRLEGGSR